MAFSSFPVVHSSSMLPSHAPSAFTWSTRVRALAGS